MQKGKYGIRLCFYTVSAFILAYLGYSTVLFMLAGVVLLAEKDEWATRQVIQAICLCLAQSFLSSILRVLNPVGNIPVVGAVWGMVNTILSMLLSIAVCIFCLIGVLKTMQGKEAGIPGAHAFANWAYGIVEKKAPKAAQETKPAPAPKATQTAQTPKTAPAPKATQTAQAPKAPKAAAPMAKAPAKAAPVRGAQMKVDDEDDTILDLSKEDV